ncbi:hypothetical protein, partial [Robertmurraya sp. Marseille-Q9965]
PERTMYARTERAKLTKRSDGHRRPESEHGSEASAPMVVRGCPLVRVGRCRAKAKEYPEILFF